MFVRVKTTKNSPKKYVQIVESYRHGDKVRQKIVRHVGYAMDEDELVRLKDLATYLVEKIKAESQPGLFSPEEMAAYAIEARKEKLKSSPQEDTTPLKVDLKKLREQNRVVVGVHEIYGSVYDQIEFNKVIHPNKKRKSAKVLKDIVMARIANPSSKRGNVADLERDFGIKIDLSAVYRMMDHLDDPVIEKVQHLAYQSAQGLYPHPIDVLFYDCTTLYFESVEEDELKAKGYSKDMKFNQSQVLLALMVTTSGLPIGYKVYQGNTFEGDTLRDALAHIKTLGVVNKVVFVADSAMLSKKNMEILQKENQEYIVGARIKNLPKKLTAELTNLENYAKVDQIDEQTFKVAQWKLEDGSTLIVSYSAKRAAKDRHDRQKAIEQLEKKLKRSKDPLSLINNYGYKKFIISNEKGRIELDQQKLKEAEKWDGLHGVITNKKGEEPMEILARYRGLWEVEETFRISKHDMKVRPIYHWTPKRIKAHLAICFMALCCIRQLQYRIELQFKRYSAEVIRNELVHQQISILKHVDNGNSYAIPSKKTMLANKIYQIMGSKLSDVPFQIK